MMWFYQLEVAMFWSVGWGLYWLLLREQTFFAWNRGYVLGVLVLGLALPLVEWPAPTSDVAWLPQTLVFLQEITVSPNVPVVYYQPIRLTMMDGVLVFYLIGCMVALGRLSIHLWRINRYILQHPREYIEGVQWVYCGDEMAPGAWFHYLFWNRERHYTPEAARLIVAHEKAHIQYRHSWDILVLEGLKIFFWWNPAWYLLKKELLQIHEFQADKAAVGYASVRDYGKLLIEHTRYVDSKLIAQTSFYQPFYRSPLKTRIMMMTKKSSSRLALVRYVLVLPAFVWLVAACSNQTEKQEITQAVEAATQEPDFYQRVDTIITFDPDTFEESVRVVKTDIFTKANQMPVFGDCPQTNDEERMQCSQQNLFQFIAENLEYPKEAAAQKQEGTAFVKFIVYADGKVDNYPQLLDKTTEHTLLNESATRVIRMLPDFQPGMQDGKPVNVEMVLPIKFKLE
ncbi:MAG: M56 family metallopeptidase [Saprospiraceae bacterium]